MNSDGAFGDAPEWYVLLKVAKWMGVSPWDLARQPVAWLRMAALAMSVENAKEARG